MTKTWVYSKDISARVRQIVCRFWWNNRYKMQLIYKKWPQYLEYDIDKIDTIFAGSTSFHLSSNVLNQYNPKCTTFLHEFLWNSSIKQTYEIGNIRKQIDNKWIISSKYWCFIWYSLFIKVVSISLTTCVYLNNNFSTFRVI